MNKGAKTLDLKLIFRMRFLFFLVHVALSMPWNPRAALEDYYDDMTGNFGPKMVKSHKLKFQKYSYENFLVQQVLTTLENRQEPTWLRSLFDYQDSDFFH